MKKITVLLLVPILTLTAALGSTVAAASAQPTEEEINREMTRIGSITVKLFLIRSGKFLVLEVEPDDPRLNESVTELMKVSEDKQ